MLTTIYVDTSKEDATNALQKFGGVAVIVRTVSSLKGYWPYRVGHGGDGKQEVSLPIAR